MKVYLEIDGEVKDCTYQVENRNNKLIIYTSCVNPSQVIEVAVVAEIDGEKMPTEVYVCSETLNISIPIRKKLVYSNKEK